MKLFAVVARWRAQRRKLARLRQALASLPELDRRIFVLCTAGVPQPEVARRIGVPIYAVQERLACTLVVLAAILNEAPPRDVARRLSNR